MKKFALIFFCVCFGSFAFARDISSELTITKGPYYVPATNEAFDVFGPDFKSEGEVVVYLTSNSINLEFPRVSGTFSVPLQKDGDYVFGGGSDDSAVRVGFEGNNLSWLFTKSKSWTVSITRSAQDNKVAPTPFAKMSDDQLLDFAKLVLVDGSVEEATVKRLSNGTIELTGEVLQMGENDDDPVGVGQATFTFTDTEGARTIRLKATIEDRE